MSAESWTPERVEQLTKLWADGLSASQVAAKMGGCTRNAVIGKVNRLGLPGRQKPSAPARIRVTRPRVTNSAPKPPKPKRETFNPFMAVNAYRRAKTAGGKDYEANKPAPVSVEHARPWLTRKFGECAYPAIGEGADTYSCCAPCGENTYCAAHRAVMVNPIQPKKRDTNRLARWAA